MPKRPPTSLSSPTGIDTTVLRATEAGTARFRSRFEEQFADDFFRPTTFGPTVSSIGIGTYLGDNTDADDAAYEAAVQLAIGSGVNLLDTAINYRSQRSERAIGAAIQQVLAAGVASRDELVVCSKGGYIPLDRTPPASREEYQLYVRREFIDQLILQPDEIVGGGHSLAPRFLRYCIAKSRQNLGLRTIDIYYVHNPGHALASESGSELQNRLRAAFGVLEEAVARSEIGVYGCATWDELRVPPGTHGHLSLEQLVELAGEVAGKGHHFRAIQVPVNLAMPDAVRNPTQTLGTEGRAVTVVEAAAELGLTVVASASLMQSRLTRGLPAALHEAFPDASTDAQRAIEFTRTLPGITAALVGMKQAAHVAENLGGVRRPRATT
jgi:aryl-alcohol dehydrogenase-like predicted oxidoreductase